MTTTTASHLAFICAMPMEVVPLVEKLGLTEQEIGGVTMQTGTLGGHDVVAIVTGMGTELARHGIERLLDAVPVHRVMVVGITGALENETPIGTLVWPELVVNSGTGSEHRPHHLGDDPPVGTMWTTDVLLTTPDVLDDLRARGVVSLDMETAELARVCEARGIPWSVFRAISDRASDGTVNEEVFKMSNMDGSPNHEAIAAFFEKYPEKAEQLAQMGADATLAADTAADAAIRAARRAQHAVTGGTTGLLVVYAKCTRASDEADWDAWEDDVHAPATCGKDGPWAATRFELTAATQPGMPGIGFTHVSVYELDDPDVVRQAARALGADAELRTRGRMHAAHATIGADVYEAHGPYGRKPEPSAALRGHILTHVLCNDPAREAEWDAWYDEQHVPDMLSCGAFGAMSRWRRVPREEHRANFLTLYDVATDTVDEAVARSAVVLAEVVAAGRKHETHCGALTVTLRPTGRHGRTGFRRGDDA